MRVELYGGPRDGDVIDMGRSFWSGVGPPPPYFRVARPSLPARISTREIPDPTLPVDDYPFDWQKPDGTLVYRYPGLTPG